MKKLKIVFSKDNKKQELLYNVVSNPVSERWIRKIKHLSKVPHSTLETGMFQSPNSPYYDIADLHREFCDWAEIEYKRIIYQSQNALNLLHDLYINNHDRLSKLKNNDLLYKFHNAIHELEKKKLGDKFYVGWGVAEGPLEEKFNCNQYYSKSLVKNCLYLPWSQLGKTPLECFLTDRINEYDRLRNLVKPHNTLRAKFMIALNNWIPDPFTKEFANWFDKFKGQWLNEHSMTDWRICDEFIGVLLAEPEDRFIDVKQTIEEYPTFHSLELL